MKIVGLSGFARAGKDTVADILVEEHGYTKVGFADKLREMLYALNPLVGPSFANYFSASKNPRLLQEVIDDVGWDGYKETEYGTEIRRLLQRLGTEAGRQTLWDTIWIDAALARFDANSKVVVSDARFINEFDAVSTRGGHIWRIERAGVGPANNHASEMEALKYDFETIIGNNGSIDDLREIVRDYESRL